MRFPVRAPLLAALLALVLPGVAAAHAEFVSGSPAPGSSVPGSIAELVVTFSQRLDPSRTSLEVRDASGATVAKGGEPGSDPRSFRLALPPLAPGGYEVRWTSFSAEDGELARGSYRFTAIASRTAAPTPASGTGSSVPPASVSPSTPPSPAPSAAPSGQASGDSATVILPILAAALLAAALGLWLARRRAA